MAATIGVFRLDAEVAIGERTGEPAAVLSMDSGEGFCLWPGFLLGLLDVDEAFELESFCSTLTAVGASNRF